VEYGLAMLELEAGDSGLRTFASVQGSLTMTAIHKFGSEAQKEQWLPGMAKGELIGCFGLTEPDSGSDPASMQTVARLDGDEWVLDGGKRWIGLASIADIAIIWAKTDDGIRGFLVPTLTPGFTSTVIEPKLGMRASIQCDITLTGVRVARESVLPGVIGLKGPLACLNEARYGIMWGALGAARDSYQVALAYALRRHQFDRPLASFQLTQQKLVNMVLEIQKGLLVAVHTGRQRTRARCGPSRSRSGSSTTCARRSRSVGKPARCWVAMESHSTTHRCATPTTSRPSARMREPMRSTL
jgi:glutaryl-CoA dehydrogenase